MGNKQTLSSSPSGISKKNTAKTSAGVHNLAVRSQQLQQAVPIDVLVKQEPGEIDEAKVIDPSLLEKSPRKQRNAKSASPRRNQSKEGDASKSADRMTSPSSVFSSDVSTPPDSPSGRASTKENWASVKEQNSRLSVAALCGDQFQE